MNRIALLNKYRTGYTAVAGALTGASEADLDRSPGPGEWTARTVVHHLADSETHAFVRLRRIIAEDDPIIIGYDEAEYARRLHYDRPIAASLEVLRAVREASLQLLERLTPDEWDRSGTHSESGPYSVDDWLRIYAGHPHDHAEQIRGALSA
ncbi:MAG TPA: DinB family protein [Acidimicrobiia bacterium]|nr:DinB family protein [Acidimicrobiia bacterium]